MSTVQRITSLECNNCLPALFCQKRTNFTWRQNVLAKVRIFRLRQCLNVTTNQVCVTLFTFENHVGPWVIGSIGAVNAFDVFLFVPFINVGQCDGGNNFALGIGNGHLLTGGQRSCQFCCHWERQRNGPGVVFAITFHNRFIKYPVVGRTIHWPSEWAESSVAQTINGR